MKQKCLIGIIGSSDATEDGYAAAREIGRLVARRGGVIVCGGLGGIMEGAARGAAEGGGLVLGILPGPDAGQANPYINLAIPTDMGHARNVIIAHAARALIAVEGEYGTLSEIAVALKLGRPVVALKVRFNLPGLVRADSPEEAVSLAFSSLD